MGAGGALESWRVESRYCCRPLSTRSSTKALPLGIGDGADGDIAVSGLEDQIGACGRVGSCRFPADHGVLGHGLGPEIGDLRVEHGESDVLARAGALTCKKGRIGRLSWKDRCRLVGHNGADHLRPASLGVRLKVR